MKTKYQMRFLSIVAFMFMVLFLPVVGYCEVNNDITADYRSESGTISEYVSGVTDGPFFDDKSYSLLSDAGFKLVEVMVWLSRPKSGPPMPGGGEQKPPMEMSMEEDALNPKNLDIAKRQVRAIFAAGATPLVFIITSRRPSDMEAYRRQVREVVEELRDSARQSGKDLKLFRFGNEPESKFYWEGSRNDLFETYRAWSSTIKSISKDFVIEAPGFASATARFFQDDYYDKANEFTVSFLDYCKKNNVPLDVLSFHYYGTSLNNLGREINAVRNELAGYPNLSPIFGTPKIGIDEWNIVVSDFPRRRKEILDSSYTAAHNVGALIGMARNGVWLSIRYGGTSLGGPEGVPQGGTGRPPRGDRLRKDSGERGPDFLMLKPDKGLKPVYYGFSAFNKIYLTPVILNVMHKGVVTAIAGKSRDGKNVNAVIAVYDEDRAEEATKMHSNNIKGVSVGSVSFNLANISSGVKEKVEVTRYAIDDSNNMSKVETRTVLKKDIAEGLNVRFEAQMPSVYLIEIKLQ